MNQPASRSMKHGAPTDLKTESGLPNLYELGIAPTLADWKDAHSRGEKALREMMDLYLPPRTAPNK